MDENGIRIAITFMPFDRPWTNVELIKDCGLIPYFLAKNHGFTVYMIGQAPDGIAPGIYGREQADEIIFTYPYFYYVDTLHFWLVKEYTQETRISLLKEIASKADLLILRGCHASNIPLPAIYKQINTSGKVYCGLDANSTWMDTILWDKPDFLQFLKNTDVMATSCTAMAEYLSEKWPKHIETITNGTCDFLSVFQEFTPFSQRENTILTVGRLGTEQKATEVLVQAFLLIEKEIPDWKLKLIGSETPEFRQFMKNIFENHPELRNRVIEPGEISGRPMLYQEYKKAKIFALSSRLEDGSQDQWAANVSKAEYPYRLSYLACDLQETNLRDKSFEIAILNGAANIDDPKAVYEEAKRMTKCPGYLLYIPSIEKKAQSRKLENLVKEDEGLVFHTSDQQSIAVLVR